MFRIKRERGRGSGSGWQIQPSASQDFMQRVEKLQNSPKNPFKLQISESQSGTTKVAWSNWDNWNKSGGQGGNWNNWGNY